MNARGRWAIVGLLLATVCACSGGSGASSGPTDPTAAVADRAGLTLDSPVDAVVRMQPGTPGKPPEALLAGNTILSARRLLQAPGGDRGLVDLWITRVRDPRGVVLVCRFVTDASGSGGGSCGEPGQDAAGGIDLGPVQIGTFSDGVEVIYDFSGPDDLTHYIITLDDQRLAVIPIEGEAIVRFDDGCGGTGTVTAWRGEVQVDEQPLSPPC